MTIWLYWQHVRTIDSLKLLRALEEPQLGNPDIYRIDGKNVSFDLLQSLDEFYGIYPHIEKKKTTLIIAELGAGYGRLGYVLLHALPKSTYIVVDLPGSLIIAQYYLSRLLSSEKILTYEQSRNIKQFDRTLLSKYTIIFLAPWQLPDIKDKSLDIFINIYSFQEMTKLHINNYFSLIDKKCAGYFYSKQSYDSKNPKDQITISLKDYPYKKNWAKIYEKPSAIRQGIFETLYKVRKKS